MNMIIIYITELYRAGSGVPVEAVRNESVCGVVAVCSVCRNLCSVDVSKNFYYSTNLKVSAGIYIHICMYICIYYSYIYGILCILNTNLSDKSN